VSRRHKVEAQLKKSKAFYGKRSLYSGSSDDIKEKPIERFNKRTRNPYLAWLNPVKYLKQQIDKRRKPDGLS
jgi:hypothetical protein